MRSPPAPPLSVSTPSPPWISRASPVVMVSSPGPASIVIGIVTPAAVTSLSLPANEVTESFSTVPMSTLNGLLAAR